MKLCMIRGFTFFVLKLTLHFRAWDSDGIAIIPVTARARVQYLRQFLVMSFLPGG